MINFLEKVNTNIYEWLNENFECVQVDIGSYVQIGDVKYVRKTVGYSWDIEQSIIANDYKSRDFLDEATKSCISQIEKKLDELGCERNINLYFMQFPIMTFDDPFVRKLKKVGFYGWFEIFVKPQ